MPTTRKRWHVETQQTHTESNVLLDPADDAAEENSDSALESERPVQGDVVNQSSASESKGKGNGEGATAPVNLPSVASDTVMDQQKRAAVPAEVNPRSPKRPRMSPIDDADLIGDQGQSHSPMPPATGPLPSYPVSAPPVVPQSVTPSDQSSIANMISQPPKANPPTDQGPSGSRTSTPSPQSRLDNLPVLSNLAGQLLSALAKMTPNEALHLTYNLANNVDVPVYQQYRTVRTMLDPVYKLYYTGHPFLIPYQLGFTSSSQCEIIHKTNQALWLTSIFSGEVGQRDMNLSFLFNFVPEGGKLLKSQGSIFLELKTQAFITAHRVRAADPRVVLADLFPDDMEQQILSRRPGTRNLAPSEQDFLKRLASRRDILSADIAHNRLEDLQGRYSWNDFNKEVCLYIYKNFGTGLSSSTSAGQHGASTGAQSFAPPVQGHMQREFSVNDLPMRMSDSPVPTRLEQPQRPLHTYPRLIPNNKDDWMAQLDYAYKEAMRGFPPQSEATPPVASPAVAPAPQEIQRKITPPTAKVQPEFQHYNPTSTNASTKNDSPAPDNPEIPHVSQTAPTQVLYEMAREAAIARASAKATLKTDAPSQRRPWTAEEESALMTGLDQVKGPHWSLILAMYGRGGSINESLKDRNQVQLKDKARNLKLFFLKNGTEVPYYLKEVTGDLKTRAPGQAERQERERLLVEENKAHYDGLQGIIALSHGAAYDADADADDGEEGDEYDDETEVTEAGDEAKDVVHTSAQENSKELEALGDVKDERRQDH